MELGAEASNYSTPYRRYDAAIGRFLGVDPLAGAYADQGPAVFASDDPVNRQDPTGLWPTSDGMGHMGLTPGRGQSSLMGGVAISHPLMDGYGEGLGLGVGPAPTVFDLDPARTGLTNPWAMHEAYSGVTSAQLMAAARQGGVYANGRVYNLTKGYIEAGDDDEGTYKGSYLAEKAFADNYTDQTAKNYEAMGRFAIESLLFQIRRHKGGRQQMVVCDAGPIMGLVSGVGVASPSLFLATESTATSVVNKIATSMRNEGWVGEAIETFGLKNGKQIILNGHHRVEAARKAGIEVYYRSINFAEAQARYGWESIEQLITSIIP